MQTSYSTTAPALSLEDLDTGDILSAADYARSETLTLFITVLTALFLRLFIVALVFRDTAAPTIDHEAFGWEVGWTARSVALGHGFASPFLPFTGPTALVPPLYTYLLAAIFRIFGLYSAASAAVILSLNSIFSALTCIPIYFAAKRALNIRIAKLAAWAWVLYPFSIYFAADRVWEYALTALLFSTCFWAVQELHLHRGVLPWLGFGALYGVTILSNPSVIILLPFLLLLPTIRLSRTGGHWLRNSILALVAFTAVCTPWTIRNLRQMHAPTLIRDGFWLEFWAGNMGDTSDSNPAWAHPASNPAEMQKFVTMGESDYLASKKVLAMDYVKHHPAFFISATIRRIVRFWTGYWSFQRSYLSKEPLDVPNVFFCTSLTLLMIRGVRRWWTSENESRGKLLPYLLVIALFPIAYYFTHSSMDYRQPIEPIVLILVVVGTFGLGNQTNSGASELISEESNDDDPVLVGV